MVVGMVARSRLRDSAAAAATRTGFLSAGAMRANLKIPWTTSLARSDAVRISCRHPAAGLPPGTS